MSERYPNFDVDKLRCSHCGEPNPDPAFWVFMDRIQVLRTYTGTPFVVTSGYRCPLHPIEANKKKPGQHSKASLDFRVAMEYSHPVLKEAYAMCFTGIGVKLKGDHNERLIHLDDRPISKPTDARSWSY